MGTRQTKNNSKQDAQEGKKENTGKNERRKKGAQGTSGASSGANDVGTRLRK